MTRIFDIIDKLAGKWIDWRMRKESESDEHLKLISAHIDKDLTEIILDHPSIAYLADQASEMLSKANATNYIQFDMKPRIDRKTRWIRVTIQYADGLSPAAKNAVLEAKNAKLRAALEPFADEENWDSGGWRGSLYLGDNKAKETLDETK